MLKNTPALALGGVDTAENVGCFDICLRGNSQSEIQDAMDRKYAVAQRTLGSNFAGGARSEGGGTSA